MKTNSQTNKFHPTLPRPFFASSSNIGGILPKFLSLCLITLWHQAQPLEAAQRIRLGTLAPKGSSYHNELKKMGQEWKEATQGNLSLTIYPGGSMGGESEIVRRMRIGQLQAGLLTAVGLTEIEPAVSGLQNLPLMFESLNEVDHIGAKLQPFLEERLEEKGFKVLFWVNAGWVHFFTKTPIATPNDLRQLKIFSWAGSPEVVDLYKKSRIPPRSSRNQRHPNRPANRPNHRRAYASHLCQRNSSGYQSAPYVGPQLGATRRRRRADNQSLEPTRRHRQNNRHGNR